MTVLTEGPKFQLEPIEDKQIYHKKPHIINMFIYEVIAKCTFNPDTVYWHYQWKKILRLF